MPWAVAFVMLAVVVMLLCFVLVGVLRRISTVLERAETIVAASGSIQAGLPVGASLPSFSVRSPAGELLSDSDLLGRSTIVIFVQDACAPCKELLAELSTFQVPSQVSLILISDDSEKGRELSVALPGFAVFSDPNGLAAAAFMNSMFPYAFLVDVNGLIAKKTIANSVDDVLGLVGAVAGSDNGSRRTSDVGRG